VNKRSLEERVLVLAPTLGDAAISRSLLTDAGMTCRVCADLHELCQTFNGGAGAILLTEEALGASDSNFLMEALKRQPDWSDVPVLLLTATGADSPVALRAMELLGNVTVLERPVRVTTLVSALRTALKARWRQYELRNRLEELRASEEGLAAELEAMSRLNALSSRLLFADDLTAALEDVLENAMVTCGADFGNIQLYNPQSQALEIVVQRGFQEDILDYFRTVPVEEGSARVRAMQTGERIIVEDVELDPAYEPHRRFAAAAGYRAVQFTPLKAHDGIILGMLSTCFRTPHRPAERDEQLLDLYARTAADLIERLRFEQALKDADRRKDEFLATLAHELRNPLAPISTAVQMLKVTERSDAEAAVSRDVIERQVGQIARLLDDLLDVSRITRDKLELRKSQVTLASVVQSALETSRPLIDEAGHDLTVVLPAEPVYLDADPVRLAQVFSNLLNNAAKYTPEGGRIRLSAERQGNEVVISVKDTGIGIGSDMLPHVFKMFSQTKVALERSQGGMGIGLWLVTNLVEMHGGSIEAHSDSSGQGSEFIVRLPLVVKNIVPETVPPSEDEQCVRKYRLLVVDDQKHGADILAKLLRKKGQEVHTAYGGEEAIVAAERLRPDVILLDIGMPKVNGYDVCRHIRNQSWGQGMYLVALTGWGQEDDRRRSEEAGFNCHLVKPVNSAVLMKLLASITAERGNQLENAKS
jgi:signal transduction histidine kinase/DNA-binding response OmpR family regulator